MIKQGRAFTTENGYVDKALLTDLKSEDITAVGEWISNNIVESDKTCDRTSYGLKHILENDIGLYMTNNQFKDAMLLAGYNPVDANELNWQFKCSYRLDVVVNKNPFAQWGKDNYLDDHSPKGDFCRDMSADKAFPMFAEHNIILSYLYDNGAVDGAIDAFEELWTEYTDTFLRK